MIIVKINAIIVFVDLGDELVCCFVVRVGVVDGQDGFEGFELLKFIDECMIWFVVIKWRDEVAFEVWVSFFAFGYGYGGFLVGYGVVVPKLVVMILELWSYEVVDLVKWG